MSKGDRINRDLFNLLQSQAASLMGVGSGQTGYGQQVLSRQINVGEIISASLFNNLRTDLAKAFGHQLNQLVVDQNPDPNNLSSPFNFPPNLVLLESGDIVAFSFLDQFNNFINDPTVGVLARKDLAAAAQLSTTGLTSTPRTTAWGGASQAQTISHTVTVTFGGYTQGSLTVTAADHARCFFNAGGSIQLSASRSGGTVSSKNTTWSNMLSGFGVLNFRASTSNITGTLNTGGTLSSSIGFFDLTVGAAAVTLMNQTGPTGVYAENDYNVTVSRPTTSTLAFTITFRDDDAGDQTGLGPPVDEQVDGTLTSVVQVTRPSGSNVDVPAPTGSATAL
jgi:hypothetical protein